MTTLYDFNAAALDGSEIPLAAYRDQVLLIVNTASKCGFTPQYAGLEALYRKHQAAGLTVLAFPCDQFGHQEPGDAAEIASFCATTYDVSFPIFAKIEVNGPAAHPLWAFLKKAKKGLLGSEAIKWNFTKFLVDRRGTVVGRYPPLTRPEALEAEVASLLAAG